MATHFKAAGGKLSRLITAPLQEQTGMQAALGRSQNMLIWLIDSLLRVPIQFILRRVNLSVEIDRNRTDSYVLHSITYFIAR